MPRMDRIATVSVSKSLSLVVSDANGDSTSAVLTRINAQELAHALLEYAGASAKSFGRQSTTQVVATDVKKHKVVRLQGSPTVKAR